MQILDPSSPEGRAALEEAIEKYKSHSASEYESAQRQANEPSYDEQGDEIMFRHSREYARIAGRLTLLLTSDMYAQESKTTEQSIEDTKRNVIGLASEYTRYKDAMILNTEVGLRSTETSEIKLYSNQTHDTLLTVKSEYTKISPEGRLGNREAALIFKDWKLTIIEASGVDKKGDEPLVSTGFTIYPSEKTLEVTQYRSPTVSDKLICIFPSLGVETKSPEEQWQRLDSILAMNEVQV